MEVKFQILSKSARTNERMPSLHQLVEWLTEQGASKNDIYIFIVAEERSHYAAQKFGGNLVTGVPGLGDQKLFAEAWMRKRFGLGQLVLHFDDDVLALVRASPRDSRTLLDLPPTGLQRLVSKARADMCKHGAHIFGVNMSLNPMNTCPRNHEPMTGLGLVLGMFYGYLTHSDRELDVHVARPQGYCEDYERSLRYFIRHGVVLRYADYVVKCSTPPGGRNSTMALECGNNHNRVVGSRAVARRLAAAFPDYCRMEKERCMFVPIAMAIWISTIVPVWRLLLVQSPGRDIGPQIGHVAGPLVSKLQEPAGCQVFKKAVPIFEMHWLSLYLQWRLHLQWPARLPVGEKEVAA